MDSAIPASGGIAAPATAAPTASPVVDTSTATTTAAPAAQGTAPTGSLDSPDRNPTIPRERFDEVNTRMTQAEKELAEWKQYDWAKSVKRENLEQMANWYGRYTGDAGEFIETILQESLAHPVHGSSVKSRIGRMLASMRAQTPQPEAEIEPDVPVMDQSGQVVTRTYSAEAMKKILQREIAKATQPFQSDLQTRQQRAKQAEEQQRYQAIADKDIAYVTSRPQYADVKDDVRKVFEAHPEMSFRDAFDHVLDHQVWPTVSTKAEAKVLSDLQQKAQASTVNPASPSGTAAPKFKGFGQAAEYYAAHPEEAERMAHSR